MDQSIGEFTFDPRRRIDRIQALLQSFTSQASHCPFYNKKIRSTCSLDPNSRRTWNCQGLCFTNGFCCDRIIDKSTEIEEMIKFLRFFPNKKK